MQGEAKDLRRAMKKFQESLASHEAARLAAPIVVEALEGWDANGLKMIASEITARTSAAVALFSTSSPCAVVIARSADQSIDAHAVLRALTGRFGGRGGGTADLAQGGGLAGALADICAAARDLLRSTAQNGTHVTPVIDR
jgi:alanyl-tRNA synthetase